jgi:hypothetical protein
MPQVAERCPPWRQLPEERLQGSQGSREAQGGEALISPGVSSGGVVMEWWRALKSAPLTSASKLWAQAAILSDWLERFEAAIGYRSTVLD